MAQKTLVILEDDLDGGPAVETVTFGLDGVMYTLDLSEANATGLRELFAPYVGAGRRVRARTQAQPPAQAQAPSPTRPRARSAGRTKADPAQIGAIRDWARQRGLAINDRGRIPRHIIEQYNAGDAVPAATLSFPEPAGDPERAEAAKIAAGLRFSEGG